MNKHQGNDSNDYARDARLASVQNRRNKMEASRASYKGFRKHVTSKYFRDGLEGEHPYLGLSENRTEYLERQRFFSPPVREKVDKWIEDARELPSPVSQKWDQRRSPRIGIIADRFLFNSLSNAANFVAITPMNYATKMSEIDILLITSAWHGLDDEWTGLAQRGSELREIVVKQVIKLARGRDIPVVFYSKEDPPNFDLFRRLAVHADVVFTTAAESVPSYREIVSPEVPVEVLPFGVNFAHHNPLGSMRHSGLEFVFAGSWLRHKYPARRFAAERLFDGLIEAGADLTIIDRRLNLDSEKFLKANRFLFPEKYLPYLHEPVTHDTLLDIQRLLPVSINLNSVTASQSMFANRVIELQAMGTLILSNYSAGVNSFYPHVVMPENKLDVAQVVDRLTQRYVRESQAAGVRAAFSTSTAFDRVDQILEAVGFAPERPSHRVLVSGITTSEFSEFADQQTYQGQIEFVPSVGTDVVRGSRDGDVHLDLSQARDYRPNFVQDIVNTFRYSNVAAVDAYSAGHDGPLFELNEKSSTDSLATWVAENRSLPQARADAGEAIGIVADVSDHRRPSITVRKIPELSIIVPVYNNGPHLEAKCFESLRRSSIFSNCEILLIDDGSTDRETISIIEQLETRYENVRVYRFPPGGSGSASRPRNKGHELVRTKYVANLDPDDEQTNDGYAKLLEIVKSDDYDFTVGNAVILRRDRKVVNHEKMLRGIIHKDGTVVDNALSKLNYAPIRIQALVARTDWLKGLGLTQVEGCQGQDTFFFQQMLFGARKVGVTSEIVHTYYGAVQNSVVNTVGPRFYEKYIGLERTRANWLREVGLLEDYNERRLEPFFKNWFLRKLENVDEEDRLACRTTIRQLASFYGKTDWEDPDLREVLTGDSEEFLRGGV